jgi:hypothetical protein
LSQAPEWKTFTVDNSFLADNTVLSIAFQHDGKKWIGTNTGGLAKFDGTTLQSENAVLGRLVLNGSIVQWFNC